MKDIEIIGYEELLDSCVQQLDDEKLSSWLKERHQHGNLSKTFFINFGLIGRKIPRKGVSLDPDLEARLQHINPGFDPTKWTLDDLSRLSLMLSLSSKVSKEFIGTLLAAADMREQVIVFRSIPYLPNAGDFVLLAIDGIRTNMVDVFDAIALDNTYAFDYFPDDAWNQMVLKAIFMERPIYRILGVDERRSHKLASILFDFVHERWSAGRLVTPELWRLVRGHLNPAIFADLRKVALGDNELAAQTAIKAMEESGYQDAIQWLQLEKLSSTYSWEEIGKRIIERK
ncbi:MAG: EboA domain-containing protein [Saprospiraceae bacterium]|nr:EboA domain-containing protein [Saprospiraceae bacterium]